MMFSSIRSKLTLWYTFVLAVVMIVSSSLIYVSFVGILRSETDANLSEMAKNFVVAANAEQGDEDAAPLATESIRETLDAFRFHDYQFVIADPGGKEVGKTTDFDYAPGVSGSSADLFADVDTGDDHFRVYRHTTQILGRDFQLIVFHSLGDRIVLEDRLRYALVLVLPIGLLLAGLGGFLVARRSFRPIKEMSDHAELISSQNLHQRLPVANSRDELGSLAIAFNGLLDRLDRSFEQQRRFMADASHELRTPLAIVRGESEVAISKDSRTADEYRESLSIVHDESRRLTSIVEDLFTLARADSGNFAIDCSQLYLDELAAECVHSIRSLAEQRRVSIVFTGEETSIRGDADLLRRLLLNLLDNAVKYNVPDGRIRVEVKDQTVSVTNTGPEIPAGQSDEIFERFFRADSARTRTDGSATSGAGLGLSIARWIAQLHGANLELSSSNGGENTFVLTFPR
ncbi:MAG: ATP-binding protein [Acidobacteriota bacterium]